jgi:hypothetical protein
MRIAPSLPIVSLLVASAFVSRCRPAQTPAATSDAVDVRDGSVATVLRALASRSNSAVVVDPSATWIASCAHVTLVAPAHSDPARLADLVAASIGAAGLTMTSSHDGWVVSWRPGVGRIPRECTNAPLTTATHPPLPTVVLPPYDAGPSQPAPLALAPTSSPADAGLTSLTAHINASIHVLGPGRIAIARSTIDTILENQQELFRTVRIIPREQGGRVIGVTLYGIRPATLYALLGFQNGDTLRTINGFDIASPDRALEAYSRIRQATNIRADFLRAGQPLFITYEVTP